MHLEGTSRFGCFTFSAAGAFGKKTALHLQDHTENFRKTAAES